MENLEKLYGVGKNIAERLRNTGYETIDAIAEANPADLATMIEVFPAVAKKIVNSAKDATETKMGEEEVISKMEIPERVVRISDIARGREKLKEEEPSTEEAHTEEAHTEEAHTEEPHTEEPHTEELPTEEPHTEELPTEEPVERVSPQKKFVSVLVELQKKDGGLYNKVLQETAQSAAATIKESVEFRRAFLNKIMKNKDFRRQVINLVAKELSDS